MLKILSHELKAVGLKSTFLGFLLGVVGEVVAEVGVPQLGSEGVLGLLVV